MVAIFIAFIFITIFAANFSLIDNLNSWLDKIGANCVKDTIIKYWDNIYDKETASFIKLVLFNIKTNDTWVFYKQTINLGVVWLIGICGFHISLLNKIIKFIFKKTPSIGRYVNLIITSFYAFLLNFTYSSIRIMLKLLFQPLFKKYDASLYERLGFIGLIICLLNPICFTSYSFLLSFIICTVSYFVIGLELNNKIIISLLINIFATLSTIPFLIEMNNKISLFTFVNAFIFTYIFQFVFIYFLLFAWFPFMLIIHYGIRAFCYILVGNISFSNIFIYSNPWVPWIKWIYYLCLTICSKGLYLIVKNNKI